MIVVKAKGNFWQNVDGEKAAKYAEALENRIEQLVANWMRDTGLCVVEITVKVGQDNSVDFLVCSKVDVSKYPYLVKQE